MSQLTEDQAKLSRIIGEISGDSPITKTDSHEFRELLQNQEKARKWDVLISSYPEWKDWSLLPTQLNQLVKDAKYGHELRKRLEESKNDRINKR